MFLGEYDPLSGRIGDNNDDIVMKKSKTIEYYTSVA
jgi:hypothetical protein